MSRIGKKPIKIPGDTKVSFTGRQLTVSGTNGTVERAIHPSVDLQIQDDVLTVIPLSDSRNVNAYQGLTRALVANMITGASQGFEKVLEINGIGYRAEAKGKAIVLNLGYSHPIEFELPDNVSAEVDKSTIKLFSIDKQELGQTAAAIRRLRPPEPFKGKGIKYADEHIQKKAGKTGA